MFLNLVKFLCFNFYVRNWGMRDDSIEFLRFADNLSMVKTNVQQTYAQIRNTKLKIKKRVPIALVI